MPALGETGQEEVRRILEGIDGAVLRDREMYVVVSRESVQRLRKIVEEEGARVYELNRDDAVVAVRGSIEHIESVQKRMHEVVHRGCTR